MTQLVEAKNARVGVVMSHGVMSHGGWFARFSAALAQHRASSIAIDRRGSGLAKGRPERDDPEARVGDLVVLLGWCWGARSAVVAAARRPPEHLVLMAPGLALTPMVKRRVDEIRASADDPASLPFEIEALSDEIRRCSDGYGRTRLRGAISRESSFPPARVSSRMPSSHSPKCDLP